MNVKAGLTFCKHLGYRALWQAKKHAPEICLAIGGIAGIGCVVTACKSTLKLEPVLEHHNKVLQETKEIIENEPERFTPAQQKRMVAGVYAHTAVQLGKLYAEPLVYGGISAFSILSGYRILDRRNAILSGALAVAERRIQAYEAERMRREELEDGTDIPGDTPEEDRTMPAKKRAIPNERFEFFWGEGDQDFGDPRIYGPYANVYVARGKVAYANKLLAIHGAFSLNDLLRLFGKKVIKEGNDAGWIFDPNGGEEQIDVGLDHPRNRDFIRGEETEGFWIMPNCQDYITDKMLSARNEMWDYYNGRRLSK